MPISKFKAKCLAAMNRVGKTGEPLRITRYGRPLAVIMPASPEGTRATWLGSMRGSLVVSGDLIQPTSELVDWEILALGPC